MNGKFREFQEELKEKLYFHPSLIEKNGSSYLYKFWKMSKDVIFVVNFNEVEGKILCRYALSVLAIRKVKEVSSTYILPWWRKDLK